MRNKSAFQKPNTVNAFKKTERFYPQPQPLIANNTLGTSKQSWTQPNYIQVQKTQNQFNLTQRKVGSTKPILLLANNNNNMRFIFTTKQAFQVPGQLQKDKTCLWFKNLPNNVGKGKKRSITFNQIEYVITNWTGDKFYSVIYICIENFQGFYNKNGQPTDRVIALQLQQLNPIIDQSNVRTYDIKYVLKQSINWDIPPQITQLKLHMKLDQNQQPIELPLPNPILLNFQIKYQ